MQDRTQRAYELAAQACSYAERLHELIGKVCRDYPELEEKARQIEAECADEVSEIIYRYVTRR